MIRIVIFFMIFYVILFLFGFVYDHTARTHPLFLSKEKEGMAGVYTHGNHKKISAHKQVMLFQL